MTPKRNPKTEPKPGEGATPEPSGAKAQPAGAEAKNAPKAKPASTYRTPGGFVQTPVYLTDDQRAALYARAAEETAKAGKRVGIGEIMRAALDAYLGRKDDAGE